MDHRQRLGKKAGNFLAQAVKSIDRKITNREPDLVPDLLAAVAIARGESDVAALAHARLR